MVSDPWVKRGFGRRTVQPSRLALARVASQAIAPRASIDRRPGAASARSRSSQIPQVARSAGSGLFAGGAQRTAAMIRTPVSDWPSPAWVLVGRLAYPARCRAAYSQSPLRSPVNIRPVRLVPLAAGARPTTRIFGSGSPNPGPGRPQYGWSAKDARFPSVATLSRHCTSLGQARHTDTTASSSATDPACPASLSTSGSLCAIAESDRAGSPGQPVQGGTGDSNSSPVTGCGNMRGVLATFAFAFASGDRQGDAVEDVVLGGHYTGDAHVPLQTLDDRAPDQTAGADHVDASFVHERQRSPLSPGHQQQ